MRQRLSPGVIFGGILILVWCLLPVVWMIMLSFKPQSETAAGSPSSSRRSGRGTTSAACSRTTTSSAR